MRHGEFGNSALFRNMTEAEQNAALDALLVEESAFQKGEYLLRAGDTTSRMGLAASGSVTIESNDLWGNHTVLSLVEEGQFFAETYALLGEPLLVDVRANEDCRALFFDLRSLDSHSEPWAARLTRNLLTISAGKNLHLSLRSFHTAPKTVRGRVMAYLNSAALRLHSGEFDIPFDRQQLADYLNLDRTALSKELGKMRNEGIIRFWKNHFVIL